MAVLLLVEQLLALPNWSAQEAFLTAHADQLDDTFAAALKEQADQFLRADVHRSLAIAKLLYYLAECTQNPLHRALGLFAEANACAIGGLGRYQDAIDLCDQAAQIYGQCERPIEQADAQVTKIFALSMLGRYAEALAAGEWASQVMADHQAWLKLANLTMSMAIVYGRSGEDARALSLLEKAGSLYRQVGEEGVWYLSGVEQNRAIVLRNLGQFESSIQANQAACELLTELGQTAELGHAQQILAFTYFVLGRYNETLALLDQARTIFTSDGRPSDVLEVELYLNECLLQLRRFPEVLAKCRHIRIESAELGRRFELAQAIRQEAGAHAGLGQYDKALESLTEARHLFVVEGNHVWVAVVALEIADLYYHQAAFQSCLDTAQETIAIFARRSLPVWEARAHLLAARAALALHRYEACRTWIGQALAIAAHKDVPFLAYQAHHLLGQMAQSQHRREEALASYERAIESLERLRGRLMIEYRADFLGDKETIYAEMVDLCLQNNRIHQGLEYTERAKSRALLDLLAYRLQLNIEARNAADRPLVEELERLRTLRDRLYHRWESDNGFPLREHTTIIADHPAVQQELLGLEQRITELWHQLLIRNADYARDAALWRVRTEPVQPYLAPDTLLLEYFVIDEKPVVFLVTRETLDVRRLSGSVAQIQRLLRHFQLNLTMASRSPSGSAGLITSARSLLHQLYRHLLAPFEAELSDFARLIVVPHGPLHYVPFHALYDGRKHLLEQHMVSYLPGASFLRYCSEATPAGLGVVAMGYSHNGQLPHAIEEAHAVARLMDGRAFVEKEATKASLQEFAPTCRVLHLATHGDFRADNPLFSGLSLADGWQTTLDTFNLRLQASLVTLSACRTGRSVVGGGDELLGLMRALLCAGARSLVLSLWTVEDRSTARLMQSFYEKLRDGYSKAAALRSAQRQFIRPSDPDRPDVEPYAHPYYWAPFYLVGDTGEL